MYVHMYVRCNGVLRSMFSILSVDYGIKHTYFCRFHINLSTAKIVIDPNADIGLRFSCFFRKDVIVRNARINGVWGEEEIHDIEGHSLQNPIESGEFFVIYILACEEKFHISINNRPFCTFRYRLPLKSLRTIEVCEQIQVIKQIDHRAVFPYPWPAIQASDFGKAFSNDSPIMFSPGHLIVITARCFDNKKGQFIIKFLESDTKREELHFSVRFDQKAVVRNSMNKAFEFGQEERHGGFPFVFNQQFKLAIAFTKLEFLTAVDGYNFCSYAYRTPDVFTNLVGFKVTCINGLHMHVTGVDHLQMGDPSCKGFEKYSKHDYECA
ncbi:32 kDa beta-galactoside-binding lectin isoform X1 [Anastrepha ludens]|uniref:32 kDa beta-galactoside-binding lectin isoform X1 n=1 Tax=Anastrepha ludens TaxID=28586 RepID=UPI0023B080B0|nr:32 kDa beta-galactoside-binding lectin isoform X1 [Anastrepha ludens]XP_053962693.1 32 kDa beta-galactoside-binding lectin isoform X1 [Anastrepha ludens]